MGYAFLRNRRRDAVCARRAQIAREFDPAGAARHVPGCEGAPHRRRQDGTTLEAPNARRSPAERGPKLAPRRRETRASGKLTYGRGIEPGRAESSDVAVEPAPRFPTEPAGGHVVTEDRSRAILAVAELTMEPFHREETRIEADFVR